MNRLLRALTFLLVLLPVAAVGAAQPSNPVPKQPAWSQLTPEQQKVLAPISKDWDELSDARRRRLLGAAKHYPQMTPAEQERFTKRLPEWSQLSREQRRLARERYERFQHLSPRQREEIIRRWEKEHPPQQARQPEESQSPLATSGDEPGKPEDTEAPKK
jgi:hypothetical protein